MDCPHTSSTLSSAALLLHSHKHVRVALHPDGAVSPSTHGLCYTSSTSSSAAPLPPAPPAAPPPPNRRRRSASFLARSTFWAGTSSARVTWWVLPAGQDEPSSEGWDQREPKRRRGEGAETHGAVLRIDNCRMPTRLRAECDGAMQLRCISFDSTSSPSNCKQCKQPNAARTRHDDGTPILPRRQASEVLHHRGPLVHHAANTRAQRTRQGGGLQGIQGAELVEARDHSAALAHHAATEPRQLKGQQRVIAGGRDGACSARKRYHAARSSTARQHPIGHSRCRLHAAVNPGVRQLTPRRPALDPPAPESAQDKGGRGRASCAHLRAGQAVSIQQQQSGSAAQQRCAPMCVPSRCTLRTGQLQSGMHAPSQAASSNPIEVRSHRDEVKQTAVQLTGLEVMGHRALGASCGPPSISMSSSSCSPAAAHRSARRKGRCMCSRIRYADNWQALQAAPTLACAASPVAITRQPHANASCD